MFIKPHQFCIFKNFSAPTPPKKKDSNGGMLKVPKQKAVKKGNVNDTSYSNLFMKPHQVCIFANFSAPTPAKMEKSKADKLKGSKQKAGQKGNVKRSVQLSC